MLRSPAKHRVRRVKQITDRGQVWPVVKLGNSYAVLLPKLWVDRNIETTDPWVEVTFSGENAITLSPCKENNEPTSVDSPEGTSDTGFLQWVTDRGESIKRVDSGV